MSSPGVKGMIGLDVVEVNTVSDAPDVPSNVDDFGRPGNARGAGKVLTRTCGWLRWPSVARMRSSRPHASRWPPTKRPWPASCFPRFGGHAAPHQVAQLGLLPVVEGIVIRAGGHCAGSTSNAPSGTNSSRRSCRLGRVSATRSGVASTTSGAWSPRNRVDLPSGTTGLAANDGRCSVGPARKASW